MWSDRTPTQSQVLRLNPEPPDDPHVRVEYHKSGEKCKHWTRSPDGKPAYGIPQLCLLCHGTGVLEVDVRLRFHKRKGMLHTYFPREMPDPEYLPKSIRNRVAPKWWPKPVMGPAPEYGAAPEYLRRPPPRQVA